MSSSEKFCLKWNDFQANVSDSFTKLRGDSKLHDVTLVTGDLKQVSAHRLVLSACSEFFKTIFDNNNSNTHPLIIMENISFEEVNFILDYVYEGKVNIFQEGLDRFLEIAKRFKLDGLVTDDDDFTKEEFQMYNHFNKVDQKGFAEAKTFSEVENFEQSKDQRSPKVQERSLRVQSESIATSNSEVDTKFAELVIQDENKMYNCTLCNKKMGHRTNMKKHIETHMTGLSYECQHCGKIFRSSNTLSNHKSVVHKN